MDNCEFKTLRERTKKREKQMLYLWYVLFILLQCTWGIVQTLIGFVLFLMNIKNPHHFYKGAIHTEWDKGGGISLGLFIFTAKGCDSKMVVHEYGHTYQSILLGPAYMILGAISFGWCNMKRYKNLRKKYGVPYSFCWTEAWANALGRWVTGLPSIDEDDK